jgi:predicted  nucleic acid-binding Zn-ribbon protein
MTQSSSPGSQEIKSKVDIYDNELKIILKDLQDELTENFQSLASNILDFSSEIFSEVRGAESRVSNLLQEKENLENTASHFKSMMDSLSS